MSDAPLDEDRIDTLVVGAGVVGLAIARVLALAGREVVIVEANGRIGEETSSRNNEVIHAGFLYPRGSLKERLCARGRQLLYAYCETRGIGHARLGKLMPAVNDRQRAMLDTLVAQGRANDIPVELLDADAVREREPAMRCLAALWSPTTGIVDSHALMVSYLAEAEARGAVLAVDTRVEAIMPRDDGRFAVRARPGGGDAITITCERIVNAAGLDAERLARTVGGRAAAIVPKVHFAKGHYFALQGRAPFRHLVVPLAETLAGGAAFTLDLAGGGRFGPDLAWVDRRDYSLPATVPSSVVAAIAAWWPEVDGARLAPTYAGIRPRTTGPGEPLTDWCIQGPADHGVTGLVNLLALESPGLTSSLAIADHVAGLLDCVAPTDPLPETIRRMSA